MEQAIGDINLEMLKELSEAHGISGNEKEVSRMMKQMVSVVFSVSNIAKQKMPLRCLWLPTWMKLVF